MSDAPIDPVTGRVKLGGRAQRGNERWRLCRWIPVRYPTGYVTHLLPTGGRTLAEFTLCGRLIDRAVPATSVRTICARCSRVADL